MILVTGGAGFIGSNFILNFLDEESSNLVINLDKLTYAGNVITLDSLKENSRHVFVNGDIRDYELVLSLLKKYSISKIVNFAAETHVDRSIHNPNEFIETNILGTFQLLEAARQYWLQLSPEKKIDFRFLHVSTDEVFGSLYLSEPPFSELNSYKPNSPYAASKASADHLVRAWFHTYGLPVITTNCSNNYGPYQFPEKLIPLTIHNALNGKVIPVYGDGLQVRDWLYVGDHCKALNKVLSEGKLGETYNIGGNNQETNISVVKKICFFLDANRPQKKGKKYSDQIVFTKDRLGHDRRYAINSSKISKELGWKPSENFDSGLKKTIEWYLNNQEWVIKVTSGNYRHWIKFHYD
jgi:dTDP-glucose 4,6-dehydratase